MTARPNRRRRVAAVALGTAMALSLPGPAYAGADGPAADAPAAAPGAISVEVVAANGSGCPPGTASVANLPGMTGFRVKYQQFRAEAGAGSEASDRRKNCQIAVQVGIPAGWTFAIAQAQYRGRARLEAGATGLQRTNYYWQGSSDNAFVDHSFSGPLRSLWSTTDVAHALVYRPCGSQSILNVNTELRVDPGTSSKTSSLSMRTTEGDVDTLFHFTWSRC